MIGCVGKLLPNVRAKIINRDTGANLGPGQVGEICIKSPFVMKGYLNQPKVRLYNQSSSMKLYSLIN